ncbi:glycosyltransferase [candidate division KSB1 bacterium]|nr:glycosyltransferase [candidate division KSB1 bacterium]
MNVLFLQEQPCIRALKYAHGLKKYGKKLRLFFGFCGKTLSELYGHGDELFLEWIKLDGVPEEAIPDIIKGLRIDLIHSQNAPDDLTVASIRSLGNGFPIIHDIHDLISIRNTPYDDGIDRINPHHQHVWKQERTAIEQSRGIIAVSEEIISIVRQKYNLDSPKVLVFPNLVSEDMIPGFLKPKLSEMYGGTHIVYEGHLDNHNRGGHYDLLEIFREIAGQGIHIHIYGSRESDLYRDLGSENGFVHYHGSLPSKLLLEEITQYDFGWAGFNISVNKTHTDTVLANKTIEYISAGLPVISFPHRAQKKFIETHNVGIVIEDLSGLKRSLQHPRMDGIRSSVLHQRCSFTVKNNIGTLYDFYRNCLLQ